MSQPDPHAYLLRAIDPYQLAVDCGIAKPAPWQMQALRSTRDRIALRVCRQAGKTSTAALLGLHNALYEAGSTTLIFAPKESQSIELFAKILAFWRRIEPGARPVRQNTTELVFANGSRVIALPAAPETVRGYTGNLLIVDEAAHMERDEELIAAILPMLARTKGRLIALSTPAGKRGWFYRICNDPRWEQFVIRWSDVDYLTEDQLDE